MKMERQQPQARLASRLARVGGERSCATRRGRVRRRTPLEADNRIRLRTDRSGNGVVTCGPCNN